MAKRMSEVDALRITNEEGGQIIAELSTALAYVAGESLTPCVSGCAGHLGEKGNEVLTDALARWDALRAQLQQVEESLRGATGKLADAESGKRILREMHRRNRIEIDGLNEKLRAAEEQRGELLRALEAVQSKLCDVLCMEDHRGILPTSHHPDCSDAREATANAQAATRAGQVAPAVDEVAP